MKCICSLLLVLLPLFVHAQLRINELMTNNVSNNMDNAFDYSMWVELYNSSTVNSYNLKDFWFTDDLSKPNKWKPVFDSIVPKQSFALLYFERSETYGHASFKLDPEGGTLYLMNRANQLIDSLTYPVQFRNTSWGRLSDGSAKWTYFVQATPRFSNNGKEAASVQCVKPVPTVQGGFYKVAQALGFTYTLGDTVYYTLNGSEPNRSSSRYVPTSNLNLTATTVVRARTYSKGKVPSDIVSNTYFINLRDHNLPVVSISTTQANLSDPKTGIYCDGDGTNGLIGNGQTVKRNYNQDWNRPVNFELFDTTGVQRLNQEVDIKILGCWTRANAQKSISISPKKKFGDNELRYDIFAATKPNRKYKDIQLRNSGNDFYYSMMRDGFMQSIVMKRLPGLDYMAYEPAVLYMNGAYWGIENLRERSNEDWVYSNYGLDEEDVLALEATLDINTDKDIATDTAFIAFSNFLKNNDVTNPSVYEQICKKMDVDNYMAYMMAEMYTGNNDWPHNNVKMWRKKDAGPWHWILSDTDFGMNLYSSLQTSNTLTICLGENGSMPDWSTVVLRRLMLNDTFRNTFVDRFAIHLSTTFKTDRVNSIMDSIAAKITNEIGYHKSRFSSARSLAADLGIMKTFSAARTTNMMNFLSARFCKAAPIRTLDRNSNVNGSSYTLNGQVVLDKAATIQYFQNKTILVVAQPVKGYVFDHWEKTIPVGTQTFVPTGSFPSLNNGSAMPASIVSETAVVNNQVFFDTLKVSMALKAIYVPSTEPEPVAPSIFINEVVSSNNLLCDEYGDKDDYLELYNAGTTDQDITGWFLSDVSANQTLANIPPLSDGKTIVPAKGWLCFWADDTQAQGPLHLPFKLSKDGETLLLSRRNASGQLLLVDSISFPVLNTNMSYARVTDASPFWAIQVPTFCLTNRLGNQLEGPVEKTLIPVWPTLVTDGFTVRSDIGTLLTVLDLNGRTMLRISSEAEETYVRADGFKPGLYIVRIGNLNYKVLKR